MAFADIVQMNVGQILQTPFLPAGDFSGKTIVITGASTGLGLQAAKHIYSMNAALLILACRNPKKAAAARAEVVSVKPNASDQRVEVWPLDLSQYRSVLEFGDRLAALPRLDVFIANAGIELKHWEMYEGSEAMLTVNVISTMLTAMLAYPKLRETAKIQRRASHLTLTGSVVHIFAKEQYLSQPLRGRIFATLNDPSIADIEDRYNLSKLLSLLAARSMAQEVDSKYGQKPQAVIINYVNPGWCKTDLFRSNESGFGKRMGLRLIGRTAEAGSRTLVHAIGAGEESHGRYLSESRLKPESSFIRSDRSQVVQENVWSELICKLEEIKPGVTVL